MLAWVRVCSALLVPGDTQGTTATVWVISEGDFGDGRMFLKRSVVDHQNFAKEVAEAAINGRLEELERAQGLYRFSELQRWGQGESCELYAVVARDDGKLELVAPLDVEGVWAMASPPKTI